MGIERRLGFLLRLHERGEAAFKVRLLRGPVLFGFGDSRPDGREIDRPDGVVLALHLRRGVLRVALEIEPAVGRSAHAVGFVERGIAQAALFGEQTLGALGRIALGRFFEPRQFGGRVARLIQLGAGILKTARPLG